MDLIFIEGFGFTNTSHEIEALHAALRQVGSMGSTKDFTLPASESAMEHTEGTGTAGTGATGFGLKPLAPASSGRLFSNLFIAQLGIAS